MAYTRKRKYSSYMGGARVGRLQSRYQKRAVQKQMKRRRTVSFGSSVVNRVNQLYRMIETKESRGVTLTNVQLPHNNLYVLTANPLNTGNGTQDVMTGVGDRIGDRITIRGLKATFFLEGAISRSKVYFRVMLVKMAKGETLTRATLFTGSAANKMIDTVNTERFTILAQKTITVQPPSTAPASVDASGIGTIVSQNNITTGNRILKFWVPGTRFGRGGNMQYENAGTQPKFFDYRWVILAYDWYGTPQDVNNVGVINECFTKLYYKDA